MKDRKLAERYARALLSALADTGVAEAADAFLGGLGRAVGESDEIRNMLLNPAVPRSVRKKALWSLAERQGLPRVVGKFLDTVVDNGRLAQLPAIAIAVHEQREKAQGIIPAALSSAAPLGPDLQDKVRASLERLTGRRIRLTCSVDPALVGGLVARIGSTVYDGTLRTQLGNLRRRMVGE